MLRPYRDVLARPGALRFTLAGLIARLPTPMVGLGIVLMISALYGSYGMAGRVSAVFVVVQAVCSPQLAKFVDRYGQAKVMRPAFAVACLGLAGLVAAAVQHASEPVLYATAAVSGATIGSVGALVRARWNAILTTPAEIHTAYSLESALDELTFIGGPVVATFLATGVTPWSALVVPIVALLVGGYWLLSQRETEPAATGRPVRRTGEPMLSGALVVLLVIFLAAGIVFGGIDVSVVAFTEEHGAPGTAGLVLAAVALGSLIAALTYGARPWESPLWLRLVVGTGLLTVGTAALLPVGSIPLLAGLGFLAGFAIAPTIVNGNSFIQLIVPPRRMTEGFTWLSAAIGIGVSLGASVSGTVIDAHGARAGFAVVAGAAATALLVSLTAVPVLRRAGERRPTLDDTPA